MGSSFANIQVHTGGRDSGVLFDDLVACLTTVLREDGFLPAEADQVSDRTILVAAAPNWIGVYDESCDELRQDVAGRLATELSRQLETHAVTILVHDSDVLLLQLFSAGELVDTFNSNPDYFEKIDAKERKALRGKPANWKAVLSSGARAASLATAWHKQRLFAEDTLRETTELLGIPEGLAGVGFRYLQEDDARPRSGRLVTLGFRHAVRPAHETRSQAAPRLEQASSSARNIGVVGHATQFSGGVRNVGGPSRGLSVVIFGDALDSGLLSIDSVQLVVPRNESGRRSRHEDFRSQHAVFDSPVTHELRGAQRVSCAAFPDLELVAGPATQEGALDFDQAWKHYASIVSIHANVFGTAAKSGRGAIHIGFVPDGEPKGETSVSLTLEVFPPAPLPLRAPASTKPRPALPEYTLFALVSLDLEQGEAAAVVAPMIERFCELLEPPGDLSVTVFATEERSRPRTLKVRTGTIPRGTPWKRVRAALEREACTGAERKVHVEDFFARRPSDGFCFGGTLAHYDVPGDPELPTLALWFDLENVSGERAIAAESLFETLLDEAMRTHSGVQAILGRTTSMYVGGLDKTDYESACGIHGSCTLRRSWLARFLRAVPVGKLWLGESLVRSIPDIKALETAAKVESFNRVLKVTIATRAACGDVERALAPLLASEEDFRHATSRSYGR